jgi:cyclophilin family peptidyl-prolyl cis-trans isomerase
MNKRQTLALLALSSVLCWPIAHAQSTPKVTLETSMGTIVVQLNPAKAPLSVNNFLQYVKDGHYNGTVFHRVIPNFMVQGGGFTPDNRQKTTRAPISIESNNGLKNNRGTIAMARTMDPNSATAQFFINVVDNDFLNYSAPTSQGYGYAVFGQVISGMDVVDKIRATPTGGQDRPLTPVTILKATSEK